MHFKKPEGPIGELGGTAGTTGTKCLQIILFLFHYIILSKIRWDNLHERRTVLQKGLWMERVDNQFARI